MSEAKFTKGPWKVEQDHPTNVVVAPNNECSLATLDCGCGGREVMKANAHLIASAPELYDALQACLDHGSMTGHDFVIEQAHAALAKARGEA